MHGTMLPAVTPLKDLIKNANVESSLPGPSTASLGEADPKLASPIRRISTGIHPSVRRKDQKKAREYAQVRARRSLISEYFN
jgi:hypothetical protein